MRTTVSFLDLKDAILFLHVSGVVYVHFHYLVSTLFACMLIILCLTSLTDSFNDSTVSFLFCALGWVKKALDFLAISKIS